MMRWVIRQNIIERIPAGKFTRTVYFGVSVTNAFDRPPCVDEAILQKTQAKQRANPSEKQWATIHSRKSVTLAVVWSAR